MNFHVAKKLVKKNKENVYKKVSLEFGRCDKIEAPCPQVWSLKWTWTLDGGWDRIIHTKGEQVVGERVGDSIKDSWRNSWREMGVTPANAVPDRQFFTIFSQLPQKLTRMYSIDDHDHHNHQGVVVSCFSINNSSTMHHHHHRHHHHLLHYLRLLLLLGESFALLSSPPQIFGLHPIPA